MLPFRLAARLGAVLLAAAGAMPAQSASLSIDIPGCTAVQLSGQAGSYTVTCTQQAQSCVVNSSPLSPQGNTSATLTVACAPAATAVTWQASRGCTVPSANGLTATVSESGGRSCVYTATANGGGSGTTTVVWQDNGTQPPPNAPSGCSIARTPANGSLGAGGGAISMSASCTGGGAVTSWSWRKNAQSGWSAAQAPTDSLPANTATANVTYTYGVTACAGNACAPEVTTTFVVAGSQPVGLCPAGADVVYVDLPWGGQVSTASAGGMRPGTMVVARLTVPSALGGIRSGLFSWVEFGGQPYDRIASLSTQACDFRNWSPAAWNTDPTGATNPMAYGLGQTGGIGWGIQGLIGTPPVLQPGATYYFNIQNVSPHNGQGTCTASTCDLLLTLSTYR
jgi:hypothetical protein